MIKEYRRKHGLKQVELAKLLGVAQSTISNAEHRGSELVERLLFVYMRRERAIERYREVQSLTHPERIQVSKMPTKSLFRRIIDGIKRIF